MPNNGRRQPPFPSLTSTPFAPWCSSLRLLAFFRTRFCSWWALGETLARSLIAYLHDKYPQADTGFYVAAYRREGRASVPHVYYCHVSKNQVQRRNVNPQTGEVTYGATWAGQVDVITRLLKAKQVVGPDGQLLEITGARINWHLMNVQDAIDFAIYAVRTTIDTMRFEARPKNVGGPIDVLLIAPQGSRWIQRKELHGQPSLSPEVS